MVAAEVYGGLSAIKTALDIVKGFKNLGDTAARNRAVVELTEKLLAAQKEQATLIETIGDLKKRVVQLETWEAEKKRYKLTDLGDGTFAYALKASMTDGEAAHYLCTGCYHQSKKAILSHTQTPGGAHLLSCPQCGTKTMAHRYTPPHYVPD
jgi:hypothetical protein